MSLQDKTEPWQVERKVPLALILTVLGGLVVQAFVAGVWASSTNNRIENLEKRPDISAVHAERIVRLETKMDSALASMTEIKTLLQQQRPSR